MKLIGIDPGVHTGFAVWDAVSQRLERCEALGMIEALEAAARLKAHSCEFALIFEDARLRTWFGKAGREVLQNVGNVKRSCSLWEEWCAYYSVPYVGRKPTKGGTKWSSERFKAVTGWASPTNEHGRDAAMLVYGMPLHLARAIGQERPRGLANAYPSAHA